MRPLGKEELLGEILVEMRAPAKLRHRKDVRQARGERITFMFLHAMR
jgi:hypothetical protein